MAVKAAYEVTITDETDILSLVTWYALMASATPPSKPTTTKTSDSVPSPWTTNEPSFDPSQGTKYLYTVIQTRWKDGSCTWDNNVQLSSSYEQAKQAWNKANAAKNAVDGLEIGGRNLLRAIPKSYNSGNYDAYMLSFDDALEIGQTYTVQLWDVNVSHSAKTAAQLGIWVYIGGGTCATGISWAGSGHFTNGHADHLVGTFQYTQAKHDAGGGTNKWLVLYNSVPSANGTRAMSVGRWKMEKGNKATDYSLAVEDAVKRTQRIYYRKNASGAPAAPGTASTNWVTNGNTESSWTKYNAWSTRVPPIADSKAEDATKYLYLYTCEQREMGNGTLAYTTVLLDDSDTIINGGNIITGTVTANQVNFADATGNQLKLFDPNNPTNYQIISSQGNELFANDVSVAKFGDVSVVGKKTTEVEDGVAIGHGSYLELDYHSLQLTHERADGSGNQTYFYVSDLRGDDNLAYIAFYTTVTGEGTSRHIDIPTQIAPANQNSADFNTRAGISACYYPDPADPTNWVDLTVTEVTATTSTILVRVVEELPKDTLIEVSYDTSSDYAKAYTIGIRISGTGIGPMSLTEGLGNAARGFAAHAEGWSTQAMSEASHAEGELSFAVGPASHVEGRLTKAFGESSHAEGRDTKAVCEYAHTEGYKTEANSAEYSGYDVACGDSEDIFLDSMESGGSHAEGWSTKALGSTSHSEGMGTRAEGAASHAAGSGTKALGAVSTATGIETIASGRAQTVIGKCNVEDTNNEYALIIGNGQHTDQRSNTLAVRWTGDGTSYNTPGALAVFSKAIDGSVTPSSNIYTRLLSGVAANGEVFGSLGMYRSADSYNLMQFEAQNAKSDGTFIYNTLKLGVKDDGTRWVGVTDAAVWRNALGLKALAQKASVSFSTTNVSKTSSKDSVAGGASIALSTPVASPGTGYYATGALGVNSNHNSVCVLNMFDGDTVKVKNTGSSKLSDITATLSFKYGKVTVS